MNRFIVLMCCVVVAHSKIERNRRDVSELLYNGGQANSQSGYSYPKPGIQTRPNYRETETLDIQTRPIYREPQPSQNNIQTRPIYREPEPNNFIQTRPIYREPEQNNFVQTRPIYRQPEPSYVQTRPIYTEQPNTGNPIFDVQVNDGIQTRPIYRELQSNGGIQTNFNLPQEDLSDSVAINSAAVQSNDASEKILFPFWNKFQGIFPPNNQYPGMNNIGYPGGSGGNPGNYPNKFPLFGGLFPNYNNYDGNNYQRYAYATTSNGGNAGNRNVAEVGENAQGVNSIGFVGVGGSEAPTGNGYDYPNPNEQQPPFSIPDGQQFRSQPLQ